MVMEPLKPKRGGFLRAVGLGLFIRDYLLGKGPQDSPKIDPAVGTYQADIFYQYKTALIRATAIDRATRIEEKQATPETYSDKKLALENEIADVFSWLFAVSNKLRLIYEKFDRSPQRLYPRSKSRRKSIAPDMCVSKRIWEEYGKTGVFACRVCGQTVCNCPIYLTTTNERIEPIINPQAVSRGKVQR